MIVVTSNVESFELSLTSSVPTYLLPTIVFNLMSVWLYNEIPLEYMQADFCPHHHMSKNITRLSLKPIVISWYIPHAWCFYQCILGGRSALIYDFLCSIAIKASCNWYYVRHDIWYPCSQAICVSRINCLLFSLKWKLCLWILCIVNSLSIS